VKRLKFFKSVEIQSTFGFNRFASTGDYQALPNKPPGNGHKITDWEKFEKFVEVNGDKTQVDMAKLWSVEISDAFSTRGFANGELR
jgi:hypothetical protein